MSDRFFSIMRSSITGSLNSFVRFLIGFTQLFSNSYFTVVKFSGDVLGLLSRSFLGMSLWLRGLTVLAAVIVVGTSTYFTAKTFTKSSSENLELCNHDIENQNKSQNSESLEKSLTIQEPNNIALSSNFTNNNIIVNVEEEKRQDLIKSTQLLENDDKQSLYNNELQTIADSVDIIPNLNVRNSNSANKKLDILSGDITFVIQGQTIKKSHIVFCFVPESLQLIEDNRITELLKLVRTELDESILSLGSRYSKLSRNLSFEDSGIIGSISTINTMPRFSEIANGLPSKTILDERTIATKLLSKASDVVINTIKEYRKQLEYTSFWSIKLGEPNYNTSLYSDVKLYLDVEIDILGCRESLFTVRFIVSDPNLNCKNEKSKGNLVYFKGYYIFNNICNKKYILLIDNKEENELALSISRVCSNDDSDKMNGLFYMILNDQQLNTFITKGYNVRGCEKFQTIFSKVKDKFLLTFFSNSKYLFDASKHNSLSQENVVQKLVNRPVINIITIPDNVKSYTILTKPESISLEFEERPKLDLNQIIEQLYDQGFDIPEKILNILKRPIIDFFADLIEKMQLAINKDKIIKDDKYTAYEILITFKGKKPIYNYQETMTFCYLPTLINDKKMCELESLKSWLVNQFSNNQGRIFLQLPNILICYPTNELFTLFSLRINRVLEASSKLREHIHNWKNKDGWIHNAFFTIMTNYFQSKLSSKVEKFSHTELRKHKALHSLANYMAKGNSMIIEYGFKKFKSWILETKQKIKEEEIYSLLNEIINEIINQLKHDLEKPSSQESKDNENITQVGEGAQLGSDLKFESVSKNSGSRNNENGEQIIEETKNEQVLTQEAFEEVRNFTITCELENILKSKSIYLHTSNIETSDTHISAFSLSVDNSVNKYEQLDTLTTSKSFDIEDLCKDDLNTNPVKNYLITSSDVPTNIAQLDIIYTIEDVSEQTESLTVQKTLDISENIQGSRDTNDSFAISVINASTIRVLKRSNYNHEKTIIFNPLNMLTQNALVLELFKSLKSGDINICYQYQQCPFSALRNSLRYYYTNQVDYFFLKGIPSALTLQNQSNSKRCKTQAIKYDINTSDDTKKQQAIGLSNLLNKLSLSNAMSEIIVHGYIKKITDNIMQKMLDDILEL